jgi:hypothetical protein
LDLESQFRRTKQSSKEREFLQTNQSFWSKTPNRRIFPVPKVEKSFDMDENFNHLSNSNLKIGMEKQRISRENRMLRLQMDYIQKIKSGLSRNDVGSRTEINNYYTK